MVYDYEDCRKKRPLVVSGERKRSLGRQRDLRDGAEIQGVGRQKACAL